MKFKKIMVLFFSVFLAFGYNCAADAGEKEVEIDEINFPDEIFRAYVADNLDVNDDMALDQTEIEAVKEIDVSETQIQDMQGIEIFTGLEYLNCSNTNISKLNTGKMTNLETLDCHSTRISQLDVDRNPVLKQLSCYGTAITELNVRENEELEILDCSETMIGQLDISRASGLRILRCDDVGVTELDVTKNPLLESVSLINTGLEKLDISGNSRLERLYLNNTPVREIDISNNPLLRILNCDGTLISQLDVEKNEKLEELHCMTDTLVILHIGDNKNLTVYTEKKTETAVDADRDQIDLKTVFPLIDADRIADVHGARINGTCLSGYSCNGDVSLSYLCGTYNKGELVREITLTMNTGEGQPSEQIPFADIHEGQWYADTVRAVYEKGLMNGTTDTLFEPEKPMTRAMAVTVLYRIEDEPAYSKETNFSDVADGTWYFQAASWAYENDIISGYEDGRFGVNDDITREQMAVMMYRYAKYKEFDVSAGGSLEEFADSDQVSDYAETAMAWAVESGIISGKQGGILDPRGNATRGECAAIILRFMEKYE